MEVRDVDTVHGQDSVSDPQMATSGCWRALDDPAYFVGGLETKTCKKTESNGVQRY